MQAVAEPVREDKESMSSKKGDVETKTVPVTDDAEPENDLDPAGLKKAFRFASWCSISLVCIPGCLNRSP